MGKDQAISLLNLTCRSKTVKARLQLAAIICAFLAAQFVSLVHAAEHGLEPHEHDGQICEICIVGDRFGDLDTPTSNFIIARDGYQPALPSSDRLCVVRSTPRTETARAPPALS